MIFSAFFNDLPDYAETVDIVLFADNSKTVRKVSEFHRTQTDLDNVGVWSEANVCP